MTSNLQPTTKTLAEQASADGIIEKAWKEAEAETLLAKEQPETEWLRYGRRCYQAGLTRKPEVGLTKIRKSAQKLIDFLWGTPLDGIPFYLVCNLKNDLDRFKTAGTDLTAKDTQTLLQELYDCGAVTNWLRVPDDLRQRVEVALCLGTTQAPPAQTSRISPDQWQALIEAAHMLGITEGRRLAREERIVKAESEAGSDSTHGDVGKLWESLGLPDMLPDHWSVFHQHFLPALVTPSSAQKEQS